MTTPFPIQQVLPAWEVFHRETGIGPIRDEADYQRMADLLEALLETSGGDENHPSMALADIVGDLIEDYEEAQHPLPAATGVQALRFLMEQHGLKQSEVPEIGSQGVVSEILAGKRELNLRQVRALAARFGVSAGTFI